MIYSSPNILPKENCYGQYPFGDIEDDRGRAIATDTFGNVYITGLFRGTVDFDPGSGIHLLSSPLDWGDCFILKLNTNGSFLWARAMTGLGGGDEFVVDYEGNVYLTGTFGGTVDFDLGPNVYNITATGTKDAFILKLNSDGLFEWAKRIGGDDHAYGHAISLDISSNIYVTGIFMGTVDFDPGQNNLFLTSGTTSIQDMFVLKLDNEGSFLWSKQLSGPSFWPRAIRLAVDETGAIYTTGSFEGVGDFDPGLNVFELTSNATDAFILKLNTSGDFVWGKTIGGDSSDGGNSIAFDKHGGLYLTGTFRGTVDFDLGQNINNISTPLDFRNAFILKLDTAGNYFWAGSIYGNPNNSGASLIIDKWNNIYTTGSFRGAADFNPDTTNYELTATDGGPDMYIHKMNQPCNSNPIINNNNITICSQETINLDAVLPSFIENISYIWNTGDTTNTILISPDSTTSYSVSVSYIYNDLICSLTDSVEVIVLEIPDTTYLSLITCDSTEAGVIEILYPDQNGCDSLVVEESIFLPVPATPVVLADIVIQENEPPFQISVAEVPGATSYLWEVPPTAQILTGANTNSIILDWDNQLINGSVCVSAINECGNSIPDCMEVTVEIIDATRETKTKRYRVFPNPADEDLYVVFDDNMLYEMVLYNVLSQEVMRTNTVNGQSQLPIKKLPGGTYWLQINCLNGVDGNYERRQYWEQIEVINHK